MSDKPIDRDGVGKTLIRKLGEKTDTEGFRTTSIDTVEGRVTMRTKGGMPEVTREHSEETVKGFLPLKEIDANHPSGNTQDARLYYHDHEKDENVPPRYVTSADGIVAVRVKPLKKSLFRSLGLGKRVDIWLNDFSKPASDISSVDYTAAGTPAEPQLSQEDEDAASSIVLMEALKRPETSQGSPYKKDEYAFSDDPNGMLYRRLYRPTLVIQPRPVDTNVDPARQRGLAFLISRVKRLVFKVSGIPGVAFMSFWFARHDNPTRSSKKAEGANGECVERSVHARPYDLAGNPGAIGNTNVPQYARSVSMVGGKISFAPPYGWMLPLHKEKGADIIRPAEKCTLQNESGTYDIFSPLTSLSHLISFGQIWHGRLNSTTGALHAESDGRLVTTFSTDEIPENGLGDHCRFLYVNFSGKTGAVMLPESTRVPDETLADVQYLTYDAVIVKGRYSFSEDSTEIGMADGQFLYRNSDGSVHKLIASFNNQAQHILTEVGELNFFSASGDGYSSRSQVVPMPGVHYFPMQFAFSANLSAFCPSPDGTFYLHGGCLFRLSGDAGKNLTVVCEGFYQKPYPDRWDTYIEPLHLAPYGTGYWRTRLFWGLNGENPYWSYGFPLPYHHPYEDWLDGQQRVAAVWERGYRFKNAFNGFNADNVQVAHLDDYVDPDGNCVNTTKVSWNGYREFGESSANWTGPYFITKTAEYTLGIGILVNNKMVIRYEYVVQFDPSSQPPNTPILGVAMVNVVTGGLESWVGSGYVRAFQLYVDGAPYGGLVCRGKVYENLPSGVPLCYDPRTNNLFVDPNGAHLVI